MKIKDIIAACQDGEIQLSRIDWMGQEMEDDRGYLRHSAIHAWADEAHWNDSALCGTRANGQLYLEEDAIHPERCKRCIRLVKALEKEEERQKLVELDDIVERNSGFKNFNGLLNALGDYRPTIDVSVPEKEYLADEYDAAQVARGDERRAFRRGGPLHP